MPIFSFEGRRETSGEQISGMREAASHAALGQDLLTEGVLLTRYEEKKQSLPGATLVSAIVNRVPIIEKVLFTRYFALMLRAGLDVKRAIMALEQQTRSKPMRTALQSVYQGVERGQTLADSMMEFPGIFPSLFISFIKVGEATGRLQQSLEILAVQLQKSYEMRRAVRGGMLYPIVIVSALFAVGAAMMIFVVPKLLEVFQGFDVELPLPTRILIVISNAFSAYWYLFILGFIGAGAGGWALMRVKTIHDSIMHAMLYTPIIGPIIEQVNLAQFSRNLSSLLKSGVSFIESLSILGTNTPHPSYAKIFMAAREHVKQGKPLSDFLKDFKRLFPPLVTNIIKVGEDTGELAEVLNEVALFYEGEVDQTMKNLTSIMEPVLMVTIGLAVGALAISVISPIYNLVNVL